jgi:hypothetical protein
MNTYEYASWEMREKKTHVSYLRMGQHLLFPFCSHQNSWDLRRCIHVKMVFVGTDSWPSQLWYILVSDPRHELIGILSCPTL